MFLIRCKKKLLCCRTAFYRNPSPKRKGKMKDFTYLKHNFRLDNDRRTINWISSAPFPMMYCEEYFCVESTTAALLSHFCFESEREEEAGRHWKILKFLRCWCSCNRLPFPMQISNETSPSFKRIPRSILQLLKWTWFFKNELLKLQLSCL